MSNPVKTIIKRSLQHIAARFGKHTRTNNTPELVILMYHRILPTEDDRARYEEPGMMVTPDTLRMHLQIASRYFKIIQLSDWIQRKQQGMELPLRACAITFDDGWADNHEYAFPVLQQLNLPASIYLTSGLIDSGKTFWPERLSRIVTQIAQQHAQQWHSPSLAWIKQADTTYRFSDTAPNHDELAQIIGHAKQLQDHDIHQRLDTIEQEFQLEMHHSKPSLLNWQQVDEMIQSGLIEFGSHTCQHTRLNSNTTAELVKREVSESKQQIEQQIGQPVNAFCFPNGDYSEFSLEQVKQHYTCALTTMSGWNNIESDNHLLKRIALHEGNSHDSIAFKSRLSTWL